MISIFFNNTADFIGGFATWAVIQIFICSEARFKYFKNGSFADPEQG
jgi:hypothetical protein